MPDNDEEIEQLPEQTFDMSGVTPTNHRFDKIIGNELRCTLHAGGCPVILVKPTEVLEYNDKGNLVLVDKSPE